MISAKAQATAARYYGAKASDYDAERVGQPKWEAEDAAVRQALAGFKPGAVVLDCPCGTGRFFAHYAERGFLATGVDVSTAMLAEADKALRPGIVIAPGSIFTLEFPSDSFDVAICCRFMNLIAATDVPLALAELQRVARTQVSLTVRVESKKKGTYHSPHRVADIAAAVAPGWRLADVRPLHQPTYVMVTLLCGG